MKKNLLLALVVMLCCFTTLSASEFINLTPRPAMMTQGSGELTLKKDSRWGKEPSGRHEGRSQEIR